MRIALALLAFLVAAPAAAQGLSPGPLTAAHAKLDEDDACDKCHSSGKQVDGGKCLACHKDLGSRVAAGAGLHGRAFKGQECSKCHVEHLGRGARLIRWPGGAADKLDHAKTGWLLEGKHRQTPCAKCHTAKTREGRPTYLGATTRCAACHQDPHEKRLGDDCAGCHKASAWREVARDRFDHARTRYPLVGKHGGVACAKCHGEPAKWRGLAFAACADCHADPHRGKFAKFTCESCHSEKGWDQVSDLRGKHPGLRLGGGHAGVRCEKCHDRGNDRPPSRGKECVSCHRPVHEADLGRDCEKCHENIRWLGLRPEIGLGAHGKTAFPLRGKHPGVACARCHDPKLPGDQRFRQLSFDRCVGCHAERHTDDLTQRFGDCAACHGEDGFSPSKVGVAVHARTRYPLDGRHEAAPCRACHTGPRPRLDLRVAQKACADCHANPHGEQFAAEQARSGCEGCHATAGWERPRVDHKTWPLTGAHAQTACARCHGAERYRGTPRSCEGCHADVHAGQFRLSSPARACEDCHDTTAFTLRGFAHAARTGWALEGKHQAVACARCHPSERLAGGKQAVRWRLGYHACKDCHADPHEAGLPKRQGAITQGLDCSTCHAPASWKLAPTASGGGFDHARTGFPLVGAHRATACAGCHGGETAARPACASCHDDAHAGRLGDSCAECHTAVDWRDTRTLARHQRTRLPLTGRHALLECTACHAASAERAWTRLPADCFACHEKDYRRDLHPDHDGDAGDPMQAPLSRACGNCHRPTAWSPAVIDPTTLSVRRKLAAPAGHDARFPISFGKHRGAACSACHPSAQTPRRVACNGCHEHSAVTLRLQHGRPVGATSCLGCHPAGRAR